MGVANKMTNGKQHTVSWHVDNLKASHVDPKVNDEFHKWLQENFGQIADATGTRGKKHVHLGMTLDHTVPGQAKVDVTNYVKSMIEDFPLDLDGKVATPANDHPFDALRGKKLGKMKKEILHSTIAKAPFLTMRARPDVRLTTSFLCTRAKEPTTGDWFMLTRTMNFLNATVNDCLIIEMDGSGKAVCSIDAACAVHLGARSHTGMPMKMGKGTITSMSRKQKLNT